MLLIISPCNYNMYKILVSGKNQMRVSDRHVQILLSEYEEKCVYIYIPTLVTMSANGE